MALLMRERQAITKEMARRHKRAGKGGRGLMPEAIGGFDLIGRFGRCPNLPRSPSSYTRRASNVEPSRLPGEPCARTGGLGHAGRLRAVTTRCATGCLCSLPLPFVEARC